MPLTVSSSGNVNFDYSIANANRVDATRVIETSQEQRNAQETPAQIPFREAPRAEVEALFSNAQEAQLNRDILNTFASSQNTTQRREFSFDDIDTFQRIYQSPLGAGPVGGTSIAIDRHSTAKMLGFDGVVENSIDATSARDFVAEYVAMISILMTNLSRISEDFIIWSTSEFSFIELSDEFTSPSSVMPQKKNPDILELTRGKTAEIIGNLTAILTTIKGLASGYGRDLQQIKSSIWSTSKISISALLIIKSIVLTMKVNEKQMKKVTESSNLIALDIAEKLVQEGIPFRVTHKIAGVLVQLAHNSKKPISKLTTLEIKKSVEGTKIDPKIVSKIISTTSVVSSLKDRKSFGSSGYDEQKRMISDRIQKINTWRSDMSERDNKIKSSIDELQKLVNEII